MVKKSSFAPMKRLIPVLFSALLLLNSCETDFDLNADYKEVMVIDGLINAIDSTQSVRISKAFLGEGNALVMARQDDSTNYGDVLDVKMQRIVNNSVMETFSLSRAEYNDKDTGIFNGKYVLYSTNHPILQDGSQYKLTVLNTQTGVTATSKTKIVNDVNVLSPIATDSVDLASGGNAPSIVRFNPGTNAKFFEMILRFNYREIDPQGNSTPMRIDWYFPSPTAINNNEVIFSFYKYNLFGYLGFNLPDKPGYTRRIDSLAFPLRPFEYILMAGSEDLQTYIELNKPSSGIVSERPLFTTVENGLGLFTSRIIHYERRFPNAVTVAAFDTSAATRTKNFIFN
jgi:hypothetical protein